MIAIDNKLVSDELLDKQFVCDLKACKGACCVEGDNGAPLEQDELPLLEEEYPNIEPYLTAEGKAAIKQQGFFVFNKKAGTFNTPLINDAACAYITYADDGTAFCGIEQAWQAGKSSFRKPVSCHLYPVRINKYEEYDAVNYERWEICNPACKLGESLKVPVYRFVKDALVRKYGQDFYEALDAVAQREGNY